MSVFADSSALVKLYADEEGHDLVHALEVIVVSALARVEVVAAIWRKERIGELEAVDAGSLVRAFEADYHGTRSRRSRFVAIEVSAPMLDLAAELVAAHGLRAYDGVQLATAVVVRDVDPGCATITAWDVKLRRAAAQRSFTLLPA